MNNFGKAYSEMFCSNNGPFVLRIMNSWLISNSSCFYISKASLILDNNKTLNGIQFPFAKIKANTTAMFGGIVTPSRLLRNEDSHSDILKWLYKNANPEYH